MYFEVAGVGPRDRPKKTLGVKL